MTRGDDTPTLGAGLTAKEARTLRNTLSAEDRERVETTVAGLLDLLGKTHTLAILSAFAFTDDPLRFSDLESDLDIAPNTLSTRLRELTDAGLLTRCQYDEVPPRVEYEPTPKAEALFPAFGHLHIWVIEHELDEVAETEAE
ncbi:helix-turn-helix transcriptional regulator [Halobacteria archaeon AArc-m2/3/4]|uniref:Helix-turn-helix transcriptional regulator n=1 Tax=Natronoglomus mannanivorans TaxID=2979990 RepID=A0ABT2Q8S3_9EURY|nr:helix-turn-helix transcriptional regulator [Halobacteria archaeon AArc-m2/3/4]